MSWYWVIKSNDPHRKYATAIYLVNEKFAFTPFKNNVGFTDYNQTKRSDL